MQVVNGAYRGHRAILEALDAKNFCVTIQIDQVCRMYVYTTSVILISVSICPGSSSWENCGESTL